MEAATLEILMRGAVFGGFVGLAVAIARGGLARARWTGRSSVWLRLRTR
jgi:hypothetical protein